MENARLPYLLTFRDGRSAVTAGDAREVNIYPDDSDEGVLYGAVVPCDGKTYFITPQGAYVLQGNRWVPDSSIRDAFPWT